MADDANKKNRGHGRERNLERETRPQDYRKDDAMSGTFTSTQPEFEEPPASEKVQATDLDYSDNEKLKKRLQP